MKPSACAPVIMANFEDEILGPDYTIDLDQFIPYNYLKLYEYVCASEARAALDLKFLSVEKKQFEREDEDEEVYSEEEQDQMDLDITEENIVPPELNKEPVDLLAEEKSWPPGNGFPPGLEIYFAIYIWALIYFEEYEEAWFVGDRYKNTSLFLTSPVLKASVISASKFSQRTTNDTLDYASIYRLIEMFAWEDPRKGGSIGLAQLVKDSLNKFQQGVYTQLRDKFTKVKVSTISKYLPLSDDHEIPKPEDVLRVLNSFDQGWTEDPEYPELLIPPVIEKKQDSTNVDGETRRKWLDDLVSVASELEQKSLVE